MPNPAMIRDPMARLEAEVSILSRKLTAAESELDRSRERAVRAEARLVEVAKQFGVGLVDRSDLDVGWVEYWWEHRGEPLDGCDSWQDALDIALGRLVAGPTLPTDGGDSVPTGCVGCARLGEINADLLEALRGIGGHFAHLSDLWGGEGITRNVIDAAKAAIAKATLPAP